MSTGDDSTKTFFPTMSSSQRPIKRQSRITKRKLARKNPNYTHFRFGKMFLLKKDKLIKYPSFNLLGGNRKDPLNLNALIQKKKQLTQSTTTNNDNSNNNHNGNDRPVEILLQPDIFDPLRLDTSSRNDEDLNNLYSIPSNSTNEQYANNPMIYPARKNRYIKKRRNLQPPRYGNFQGYYGYRQPNHDQRLRYLEHDWFNNKQVLDVGRFISKQKQYRIKNPNIQMMNKL
jgi:hypothetical protein